MLFNEWIAFIFDHPVTKPEWPQLDAEAEVAYITQIFENAEVVLQPFSDAQVNQGLYLLLNDDYMFALREQSVLLAKRLRCIHAMEALFTQCFAVRCSPHLLHSDWVGANPLNSVCYMWWDILPIHGLIHHHPERTDSSEIDRACLSVMKNTLEIASVACQESALHGLGHWSIYYPEATDIIDDFLLRHNSLSPKLRAYAIKARHDLIA